MPRTIPRGLSLVAAAALAAGSLGTLAPPAHAAGSIALTALATAYTQDFNTLVATGSSADLPPGWALAETGTSSNVNGLYAAGTGSNTAGDTYSFGTAGSTERAFGQLLSGSLTPIIGASFTNGTGATITDLAIAYTGEQWRLGAIGRADRLDFQVSLDATSLTTGTWTDVDALDFSTPVMPAVGSMDGNAAPNRTALSATIGGLAVAPGAVIWIRWTDVNVSGSDDGLAVDDFSLTPSGIPIVVDQAPTVASTVPANGATDVGIGADLAVTFSEPVDVAGTWYTLICATSGTHAGAVSGGPVTYAINPGADFANGETCTLTIFAANVADQDTDDPPDALLTDVAVSFTTANAIPVCDQPFTPIPAIQGSGASVALTGTQTTEGVVVADYEGASPALRGFFIQDPVGDASPATSNGIFVFEGTNANTVNVGDLVRVSGNAGENQGQSQISVGTITNCGTGSVAPTDITFPVATATELERYEGMLVRLPQAMYVTEHFQLGRFGQVVLSANARLRQPTDVVAPGAAALAMQASNSLNRIIVDDASQAQNPDPIMFGRGGAPLSATNTLRGGDTATGIVGVMTWTWGGNAASPNAYRVRPIGALGGYLNFEAANPRPDAAPSVGGRLTVGSMNLLNWFNTFTGCTNGVGGTAADCRGASNQIEFDRQAAKTVIAITAMDPAVLALNEVENDGYGPTSALAALVDRLNAATAPGRYAFIDADTGTGQVNALGVDGIKVGMLYQPARVTPVGTTAALNTPDFVNGGDSVIRTRPALAQAFEENGTGARFIMVANHFKSKGSACDVPDAGDGQGNCALVRKNAATVLAGWLATDPTGTTEPDVLLVGDFNSYAKEDPIAALEAAGYTNLIADRLGPDAYSYVFDGQWAYLDYAFGSPTVLSQVAGVGEYHINADEPSVLDYNTEFKSAAQIASLYAADPFRVSDHDPVVVGLDLNVAPVVSAGGPYEVDEGGSVELGASASDADGDPLTYAWDLDGDGTFETGGRTPTFSAAGMDGPSSVAISVRVTDGTYTVSASTTISVQNVAPLVGAVAVTPSPSLLGAAVVASAPFTDGFTDTPYSCTVDYGDGSGVLAGVISDSTCTGPSHVYLAVGSYVVTVAVTDKDGATGSASSAAHRVLFDFQGFYAPVDPAPTFNKVKAGQGIPIKFSLSGDQGLAIFAPGSPVSRRIACESGTPVDAVEETVTAGGSSLNYDPVTGRYTYVWKTSKAWSGTCRELRVTLVDGSTHIALFRFTK